VTPNSTEKVKIIKGLHLGVTQGEEGQGMGKYPPHHHHHQYFFYLRIVFFRLMSLRGERKNIGLRKMERGVCILTNGSNATPPLHNWIHS
jgi:hypothetical protein